MAIMPRLPEPSTFTSNEQIVTYLNQLIKTLRLSIDTLERENRALRDRVTALEDA